jgi:glycosyltransferase involved in cell wall biosynthesis
MHFARLVWRWLPLPARRFAAGVLIRIRSRLAPDLGRLRPARSYLGETVLVAGVFQTATGLGKAAELVAQTLESTGSKVGRVDLTAALGIPISSPVTGYLTPSECSNINATDLVIVMNPGQYNPVAAFDRQWLKERCVIGHWIWELEQVPGFWRWFLKSYDEIWSPTENVQEALFHSLDLKSPPKVVPYSISRLLVPNVERSRGAIQRERLSIPQNAFVVGYSFAAGSNYFRKNPEALIDAFKCAFSQSDGSVYLLLRCRDLPRNPDAQRRLFDKADTDKRIIIVDNDAEMSIADFYAAINLYASPSRSEGYGLNLVEAAQWSIPVITSGWRLPEEIKSMKAVVSVPHTLVSVEDPQGHYSKIKNARWSELDLSEFARQMRKQRDQINK